MKGVVCACCGVGVLRSSVVRARWVARVCGKQTCRSGVRYPASKAESNVAIPCSDCTSFDTCQLITRNNKAQDGVA